MKKPGEDERFAFVAWSMFCETADPPRSPTRDEWDQLDATTKDQWKTVADGVFLALIDTLTAADFTVILRDVQVTLAIKRVRLPKAAPGEVH